MADNETIQTLLRLKRYEQPPPDYFEDFLKEFQKRQREEMLRQPVWRIALDRMNAFFSESVSVGYRYAAVTLTVLAVTVTAVNLMVPEAAPTMASAGVVPSNIAAVANTRAPGFNVDLQFPEFATVSDRASSPVDEQPRYVIDTRPVSYEFPGSL